MSRSLHFARVAHATLLSCLVLLGLPGEGRAQDFDVLIFSKTAGFRHGSISDGIAAVQALGAANNFSVDTTEDAGQFTDVNLAQYEAVVFLNTTGDILDSSQQGAFERYIQAGGGWVGTHSATDTEYSWPWYGQLIGNDAWFNGHPAVQSATLTREDPSHLSTAHYPASFSFTDEWYNFQNNPRVAANVLVTIDESTYGGGNMGSDHPISWSHEFDGGRSWYTAMGHRTQTFTDANFRQHLLGGILWAAFQDNPCNDGDPCTDDTELPGGSCQYSPNTGAACEDGNPCTTQDTCASSTCSGGSPTDCNDGNACTTDSCNAGSGCQNTLSVTCPSGEVCSASTGTCEVGLVCIAANDPSANLAGAMTTGTQFTAGADADPALDNLTSPLAYANSSTNASDENSGDQVTYLMAVPATDQWFLWARMYFPSSGGINGPDSFFASLDGGSATKLGNNQDFHQVWHWDGNGNIEFGSAAGLALGTISAGIHSIVIAKREVGSAGEQPRIDVLCLARDGDTPPFDPQALAVLDITPQCSTNPDCNDDNPCTNDTCSGSVCINVPNSASCNDSNACTTNDQCSGGSCTGSALDCNDGNPCSDDSCNAGSGCMYTDNSAACDDSNGCTTLDTCSGGVCFGGAAVDCEDGNLCTDTSCDRDAGCVTTANGALCDDGDICTIADGCDGGICTGGALACEQAGGTNGTATTDSEQDGATADDILETTVVSPTGGQVTIDETQLPILEVVVSAPTGAASDPMIVLFTIDSSLGFSSNAAVRFDGMVVGACTGGGAAASPDPCIPSRSDLLGGDVEIEARSSSGGTWAITSAPSDCALQPRSDCLQAEKGQLLVKNKVKSSADQMKWKWIKGEAVAMADLGDPNLTTTYTLCVYDQESGIATLKTALTVTPNPLWGLKGSSGWQYSDRAHARSGVQKALITTGAQGRTKASVRARGENLPIPEPESNEAYFTQDPGVTVQLTNTDGVCWTTELTAARKNTGGLFKAKTP
jgi:type 1 glutamine amidotransferase